MSIKDQMRMLWPAIPSTIPHSIWLEHRFGLRSKPPAPSAAISHILRHFAMILRGRHGNWHSALERCVDPIQPMQHAIRNAVNRGSETQLIIRNKDQIILSNILHTINWKWNGLPSPAAITENSFNNCWHNSIFKLSFSSDMVCIDVGPPAPIS